MRKGQFLGFDIFIILVWSVLLFQLYSKVTSKSFIEKEPTVSIDDGTVTLRKQWSGLYLGQTKVGYSFLSLEENMRRDKSGKELFHLKSESYMRIPMMDVISYIKIITNAELEQDLTFYTVAYSMETNSSNQNNQPVVFSCKAERTNKGITITTENRGEYVKQEIPCKGNVFIPEAIPIWLVLKGLSAGKQTKAQIFFPMLMTVSEAKLSVREPTLLKLDSEKEARTAYEVDISIYGFEEKIWIDKEGFILKEESKMGDVLITSVKETEKKALEKLPNLNSAKDVAETDLDLIFQTSIFSAVKIDNPRNIVELLAILSNLPSSFNFDFDHFQQEIKSPDIQLASGEKYIKVGKLNIVEAYSKPKMDPSSELFKYLSPTSLIQSENSRIIKKANEIATRAKNDIEEVRLLCDWTYKNIDKQNKASVPSALEVLDSLIGDCNEHSTLLCALLRARGFPSRLAMGIVYNDGRFYYHAWNEVYLSNKNVKNIWLPIDSIWNQIPVDATHIKLASGDISDSLALMSIIGRLQIRIIDYK